MRMRLHLSPYKRNRVSGLILSCCFVLLALALYFGPTTCGAEEAPDSQAAAETPGDSEAPGPDEPTGAISLTDALAYAIANSPQLKSYSLEVRIQEAQSLQAGLLPNPELDLELADFGGSGARSNLRGSETTIQLGQLIELAGKRGKRQAVADLAEDVARSEYELQRRTVMLNVTQAFIDVLYAQQRTALLEQLRDTCSRLEQAAEVRVSAGKDAQVELTRAKMVAAEAGVRLQRATDDLEKARIVLASTWGSTEVRFERATGSFQEVLPVPDRRVLVNHLADNPRLLRWSHERSRRKAAIELERARAVSDIRLGAGVRHFADGDDTAFIVGLAIPLPLFDRNQAGIRQASAAHAQAIELGKAAEIEVRSDLLREAQDLSAVHSEVRSLEGEVLPAAQEALESVQIGYRDGKFDYLYALDTQRATFESREHYLDVLRDYHSTRAKIEWLIGRPLDSLK